MKLKELCKQCNVDYNAKNPKRSLERIKKDYLIEQSGNNYSIIRELTATEKSEIKKISDCKKLLQDTIYVSLSLLDCGKIRADMKGLLELFNIVNNKYRHFSYERMTEEKYNMLIGCGIEDPKAKGDDLFYFFSDIHPILSRMVKDTFDKMIDERLIYKKEILMIGHYEKFTDSSGNVIERRWNSEATDEETRTLLEYSRQFMSEKNYVKWSEVPYYDKIVINKKICKAMGISYTYNDYEIIINNNSIKNIVENDYNLKVLKDKLNKSTIDKLLRCKQGGLKDMSIEHKAENIDLLIKNPQNC